MVGRHAIKDISRQGSAGALRRGWFIIPAPADQWPLLLFRKICLEAVTSHWSAGANRRINHKPLRAPRPADVFPPFLSYRMSSGTNTKGKGNIGVLVPEDIKKERE